MVDIVGAIIAGDLATVKSALAQGTDPNTVGQDNLKLVQYAAMANQPLIFAELIKYHANVDAKDNHNNTALYYAARHGGSKEFIQQIIQAGADINNQNKIGQTATHIAVRIGNNDALEGLLKNGANPNIKDIVGKTPLIDAVKTNHPEAILPLLEYGANPTIKDNYGATLVSLGLSSTNPLIKDIVELPILNKLQIPTNSALLQATVNHEIADMQAALAKGASANTVNQHGITAIQYAALHGFSDAITLLKSSGGDIIQTNFDGMQAIHFAAMTHQTSALATLISLGASPNAVDYKGNTPLHYAAQFTDEPAFIQKLLDAGASINTKNNAGETPLHLAAADGNLESVKFLVANHANVTAVDLQGETPMQEAIKTKHSDVATFLSTQSKIVDSSEHAMSHDLKSINTQTTLSLKDVFSADDVLAGLEEQTVSENAAVTLEVAEPTTSVYIQPIEITAVHAVDAIL